MSIKQSRHLYDILEVNKDATKEEITKAYREKAVKYHPDKGGDASIFIELANAYNTLIDDEKRKRYDETGYTGNQEEDDKETAFEVLTNYYMRLLSNEDELKKDVIKTLEKNITQDIMCCKDKCKKLNKKIEVLEKTKNKFKYKGNSLNILRKVTDDEISFLNNNIKKTNYQEYIDEMIINILQDYEYQTDDKGD